MPRKTAYTLGDFDYDLPPGLIAQTPLPERSASRLLVVDGVRLEDRCFAHLAQLLKPGDLLVMNDTRVLHARLYGVKDSGGKIEVMVERVAGERELIAQVRASKPPKPGSTLWLEEAFEVGVIAREGEFYRLRLKDSIPGHVIDLLERHGRMPLPPYIDRVAVEGDETRYQTVFAREHGSVAAPTAGLHFDKATLAALQAQDCRIAYVTLHVGAGTFQPVRTQNLTEHRMHSERYFLPQETVAAINETKKSGGRVIAVGTTSLRTLESAALHNPLLPAGGEKNLSELHAGSGETDLFILPGFRFRVADVLLTNFHLPKSTLLMLISAFAGYENICNAYQHAIRQQYRFFSYGDAMLLTWNDHEV